MNFKTFGDYTLDWNRVEVIHEVITNRMYVYTSGNVSDDSALRFDNADIISQFYKETDNEYWVKIGKGKTLQVHLPAVKFFFKVPEGYRLGLNQRISNVTFTVTSPEDIAKIESFLTPKEPEPNPVTILDFFHDKDGFNKAYVEFAESHK